MATRREEQTARDLYGAPRGEAYGEPSSSSRGEAYGAPSSSSRGEAYGEPSSSPRGEAYGAPPYAVEGEGGFGMRHAGVGNAGVGNAGMGPGEEAHSRGQGGGGIARLMRFLFAFIVLAAVMTLLISLASNAGAAGGGGDGLLGALRGAIAGGAGPGQGPYEGEDGMPALSIPYDSDEGTVFCLYRGFIAECTKDGLFLYDRAGAEVLKANVDFLAPGLSRAGNYLVAYDIGGRAALAIEGQAVCWEERFTSNIISGAVNKDGYMAFVLETSAYRNSIRVMAPVGRKLYDWIVADDYVVSAEVAPDDGSMMVNRLKTDGISVRSSLEFLDMRSEPFAALDSGEDNVYLNAKFLGDGAVATVTGTDFAMYSSGLKQLSSDSFEAVMAMCEFPARKASVAAQIDGRLVVKVYGQRGEGAELYAPELPVVNMASGDGLLLVNMGRRVAVVYENGKTALSLELDSDALYGSISGKQQVLVVTKKSADLYDLR